MKALLVALLAFSAPSAHALSCISAGQVNDGNKVFITLPALKLGGNSSGSALFVTPSYRNAGFADNLCRLCGYGQEATAMSFLKVGPGDVFAVLNSDGQLSRIGQIDVISLAVDSLTCEK